jgi:flagellar biosynthesis/type III secretory pathway protein FliH
LGFQDGGPKAFETGRKQQEMEEMIKQLLKRLEGVEESAGAQSSKRLKRNAKLERGKCQVET